MIFTIDRINRLRAAMPETRYRDRRFRRPITTASFTVRIAGRPTYPWSRPVVHEIINQIDKRAGIDTRCASDCPCRAEFTYGAVPCRRNAYVGERLARLERHVFGSLALVTVMNAKGTFQTAPDDFTFWLGADGENPDQGRACDCSPDCDMIGQSG